MAMTMKTTIFWDMTPCSLVEVYQHSGEMSVNLHHTTKYHILKDIFSTSEIPSLKSIVYTVIAI
jgi:hypothetical protein